MQNDRRRPEPVGGEDILSWLEIMQVTSLAAVITNAGLVCFTMDITAGLSRAGQLWIFIGFQYTIFAFMAAFSAAVDDMPEDVSNLVLII